MYAADVVVWHLAANMGIRLKWKTGGALHRHLAVDFKTRLNSPSYFGRIPEYIHDQFKCIWTVVIAAYPANALSVMDWFDKQKNYSTYV